MKNIALVTDSTCDLPVEILQRYNIYTVPLNVIFGSKSYKDGVNITVDEFFTMLTTETMHPRTSQPSPGDFASLYAKLCKEYDHILSIHLSGDLSGTCQSAMMGRDLVPEANISILDTKSASLGLGLVVVLAARAVRAGKNINEIIAVAERAAGEQHVFLTVESLEWLHKNGRIGKAEAMLGNLLNVRPILHLEEGIVAPYGKMRGKMEKVIEQMVNNMTEFVSVEKPVMLGVVHADRPDLAAYAQEVLCRTYTAAEVIDGAVGPVIGVNTGPGTIGFVALPYHDF